MSDKEEIESDSSDDEDYVPDGGDVEEEEVGSDEGEPVPQEKQEEEKLQEKQKADSIWSDFLKDVGQKKDDKTEVPKQELKVEPPKKVTIEKTFDFAGETVSVTKEVDADSKEAKAANLKEAKETKVSNSETKLPNNVKSSLPMKRTAGGLSSIMSHLDPKKKKMSTLHKSQLDWTSFKKDEGIEEELDQFRKGKDGFLEKRDFLERTDLRRFEIEKGLRQTTRRSNR